MERVFVDTDVILDLLAAREPHYIHAAELFSLADSGKLSIHVASLSFANLNYILSKQFSSDQARKKLLKFKTLVTVCNVSDKIIELALVSEFKDFEDAIQYYTATENRVSVLLTRNVRDFKKSSITVLTAEQFIKTLPI